MLTICVAALRGARAAVSAALARRRDIDALRAMTARELSDLGIVRSEIESYVDGLVARTAHTQAEAGRFARIEPGSVARARRNARLRLVHSV